MTPVWARLGARERVLAAGWTTVCVLFAAGHHGWHSWHFFAVAGSALIEPGQHSGLHLYAAHPELQFGPVTVAAAAALTFLPAGQLIAAAAMVALGVVSLTCVIDASEGALGRRAIIALVAVLAPLWAIVAVQYAHLDDTLAITFVALALTRYRRQQWWWTTILLALAVGAKPWALPIVVLMLGAPRRRWPTLAAVGALIVAVPWLPFFLADHATDRVGSFAIPIDPGSGLRALGVHASGTPAWDRPAQVIAAAALGILAIRRGRWAVVPFVAVAARIAIDPGAQEYYAAGLALTAAFVDAARGRRWPAYTLGVGGWVLGDLVLQALGLDFLRSAARLVLPWCGALAAILEPRRPAAEPAARGIREVDRPLPVLRPQRTVTGARHASKTRSGTLSEQHPTTSSRPRRHPVRGRLR